MIELGSRYLQIVGISYLFSAVSFSYSSVLKGMGRVQIPMLVSLIALSLKAMFSYTLIFCALGYLRRTPYRREIARAADLQPQVCDLVLENCPASGI